MHPAEHDHIGGGGSGLAGQLKGVADEVGDVLDGVFLVIVGQDHGVALALQLGDRPHQVGA